MEQSVEMYNQKGFKSKFINLTLSQTTSNGEVSRDFSPTEPSPSLLQFCSSHNIFHKEICAECSFVDNDNKIKNTFELKRFNESGKQIKVRVKIIDSFAETMSVDKCTYENTFVVSDIKIIPKRDEEPADFIRMYLVDSASYSLLHSQQTGTLKTQSQDQNTSTNFIKAVYGSLGVNVKVNVESEDDVPHTIKLDPNKSIFDVITSEEENGNVFCTRRNRELVIGALNNKSFQSMTPDNMTYTDIYDDSLRFNNPGRVAEVYEISHSSKSVTLNDVNIKFQDGTSTYSKLIKIQDVANPLILNNFGSNSDFFETSGDVKQVGAEWKSPGYVKHTITKALLTRNVLCITVPTSFYIDDVGTLISFVKKNTTSKEHSERLKGDPELSGNWIIGECIHIVGGILGMNMCNLDANVPVSTLVLYRFDNPKIAKV